MATNNSASRSSGASASRASPADSASVNSRRLIRPRMRGTSEAFGAATVWLVSIGIQKKRADSKSPPLILLQPTAGGWLQLNACRSELESELQRQHPRPQQDLALDELTRRDVGGGVIVRQVGGRQLHVPIVLGHADRSIYRRVRRNRVLQQRGGRDNLRRVVTVREACRFIEHRVGVVGPYHEERLVVAARPVVTRPHVVLPFRRERGGGAEHTVRVGVGHTIHLRNTLTELRGPWNVVRQARCISLFCLVMG